MYCSGVQSTGAEMRKYLTGNGISPCPTTVIARIAKHSAQVWTFVIPIPQKRGAHDCQPAAMRLARLVEDSVALHQRA